MHDYRKLDVYRRSLLFTKAVRQTTATFPKSELYGLTSQFHRAVDSIALNIAEGSGNDQNENLRSSSINLYVQDMNVDAVPISQWFKNIFQRMNMRS